MVPKESRFNQSVAASGMCARRAGRTVIHVKRANMFDPMGWFEVPSVSRKWIAGRLGGGGGFHPKITL